MSATEHHFDRIAHFFYEQNKPILKLDEALHALDIIDLDVSKEVLKAAMSMRGVFCVGGELRQAEEVVPLSPPKPDFSPFVRAAREAVDMAVRPIPAGDLLGMSGLVSEALPADGIADHLKAASIYFIPGLGYWRSPQFANERGELFSSVSQSRQVNVVNDIFTRHGWPLAGQDIERLSNGEVTSRFCTLHAAKLKHRYIKGIGNGLFVPIGAEPTKVRPIPLTKVLAEALIDHKPSEPIFRSENVRLYKIASLLAKHGHATVKEKWEMRSGRHQRAVMMELTEEGFASLKGFDRRAKADEF